MQEIRSGKVNKDMLKFLVGNRVGAAADADDESTEVRRRQPQKTVIYWENLVLALIYLIHLPSVYELNLE